MSLQDVKGYAGDLSVEEAFAILANNERAALVDVRTRPEWQFVGVPDLTALGKSPVLREWQTYPEMNVSPDFVPDVIGELERRGANKTSPVIFLCRSGARSRHAAIALTSVGWSRCYNIADGFEGALDGKRQRGALGGWRAHGLPWTQS
jgi:rhodanese-related sulfurtransferase